ncbi:MAG: ABC transporter ATP-binding protein [Proteobacteria bacterium]|nr:MAG: ABC transporter ATP-binding protein [Pseudomonadota bacterium]
MESLLIASHLRKSFGSVTAVQDISLEVKPGECLALLGPNGAGKTTTVEMLEGLQSPDSGSITIFGKDLKKQRSAIMHNVGVMLQDTQMYKRMSVRETLNLFASFFNSSMPVDEAIALVELQDKADTHLVKLSGSQKQRAYLACALINNPRLLFLDEPTTGLDPQARRMIWDLLLKHKTQDRSILLTTHYMDEAEKLADRIAVIDHGKIIAEGSPQSLIETVCGTQILCFRFAGDQTPEQIAARFSSELPWVNNAVRVGETYELMASDQVNRITELCRVSDRLGLVLDQIELRRSTLEDVFIKLTGRSMRDA